MRSGERARLLPMCTRPSSNPVLGIILWIEFVVGCFLASRRFYTYSGFPLSSKTNISNFQFDPESEDHRFIIRLKDLRCYPFQTKSVYVFYLNNVYLFLQVNLVLFVILLRVIFGKISSKYANSHVTAAK